MRPRQWVKNLLVLAAPALGGVLDTAEGFRSALIALVAFTLASAGTYLVNDARDAEADRLHPVKRTRPIAAGVVPVPMAYAVGGALMTGALLLGALTLPVSFLGVLIAYVAVTLAYQAGAKHLPIWEMVIVAVGFVLRLIAGGVATGTPLSSWFLIVGGAAAFFVVVTKRKAEIEELASGAPRHRPALAGYSRDLLLMAQAASLGVALAAYALWAFTDATSSGSSVWLELSIVPLFMGMLRFAQQADILKVSAPEELILRDPQAAALGFAWVVLVAIGLAGG
jgi:decaprenyl-phosphate phosphoribosyltransferase